MAAWHAEQIQSKFSAEHPGHLTDAETRFWARLNRVYDGDLDAFDRSDVESAEDAEYERILALVLASPTGTVACIVGDED